MAALHGAQTDDPLDEVPCPEPRKMLSTAPAAARERRAAVRGHLHFRRLSQRGLQSRRPKTLVGQRRREQPHCAPIALGHPKDLALSPDRLDAQQRPIDLGTRDAAHGMAEPDDSVPALGGDLVALLDHHSALGEPGVTLDAQAGAGQVARSVGQSRRSF
jgi:hypothetical protein